MVDAQTIRLSQGEQAARRQVKDRVTLFASRLWGGLGSYRDADIDQFVERVLPVVLAGRTQTARLTDAYLARVLGIDPSLIVDVADLRGVPDVEVYRRPATQLYTELSEGKPYNLALQAAGARLVSIVAMDMQMSMAHQAQRTMGRSRRVEAYARTLTGAENCALCVIASTQRYWKKDLLPIHPGCDCGVMPLGKGEHYDQVIDPGLLESTHDLVSELRGSDRGARGLGLGKTTAKGKRVSDYTELVVTRQHGEYGPTLSWRHQKFTGPADI